MISLSLFHGCLRPRCSLAGATSVYAKRPDKKKERQLAFGHRAALQQQLAAETNAALALHLAVVIVRVAVA